MMTFLHSRYNSRINFSPKELFDISEEISRNFAPSAVIDKPGSASQTRLTAEELLEISQEISRDFSPGFTNEIPGITAEDTLASIELCVISEEISREYAPDRSAGDYGLVLLPVDPWHLHAYWNLEESPLDMTRKIDTDKQLTLRVYSGTDKSADVSQTKSWFDIAVNDAHAQQKVSLPMPNNEITYLATIGQRTPDNSLAALASSNFVNVPRGKVTEYQTPDGQKALPKPLMSQAIIPSGNPVHFPSKNASGQSNSQ